IRDVDEVSGSITLTGGLAMMWKDFRLTWNPEDYDGISRMMVNSSKIWSPNIFLVSSSADLEKFSLQDVDARILNIAVESVSPGMIRSTCTVDMTNFPTDFQTCHLMFLPWGYLPTEIQLSFLQSFINLDDFDENGEWSVDSTTVEIYNSRSYETNPAVYTIVLRRKSAYFVISMVVPVYILCFLNPFVFLLPAASGERISFTITKFLSLAVYMTLVGDNMPKVSEPMAGISYFLLVSMIYSCVLIILTIFTLRSHARNDASHFPKRLKQLVLLLKKPKKSSSAIDSHTPSDRTENGNNSGQNATQSYDIDSAEATKKTPFLNNPTDLGRDDIVDFVDKCFVCDPGNHGCWADFWVCM
ncbi:LOW QUALITY PROTEIN: neuronal acetylcholine receptor subunit alpha-3-like, partial [Pecten maximus]|uniref:LOW QUALITY PROTEIN: neuronal acetylcholine receptor subunit alpha-3-like n=1 Tax=Pecten maximus TaxID=6579 RepID=UPI00145821DC